MTTTLRAHAFPVPDSSRLDSPMRLDLFLKWSRILLRRALAKETCDAGRVLINGHEAGPGRNVRVGDILTIRLPRRVLKVRVRTIPARAPHKEGARDMIESLEDRRLE